MAEIAVVTQREIPTIGIRSMVPRDQMQAFFSESYGRLFHLIGPDGVTVAGAPYGRFRGMPSDPIDVEAGIPVTEPTESSGDIVAGVLPATEAVEAIHVGPYDTLPETYGEIIQWLTEHNLVPAYESWEMYLTDPMQEPDPSKWQTRIVWPIASADG